MRYLHTMVRVADLDASLDFYCSKLGLVEVSRSESSGGRFTLVFLCAPGDEDAARQNKAPMVDRLTPPICASAPRRETPMRLTQDKAPPPSVR